MSFRSEVQSINALTKALRVATSAAIEFGETVKKHLHDGSNPPPPTSAETQGSAGNTH